MKCTFAAKGWEALSGRGQIAHPDEREEEEHGAGEVRAGAAPHLLDAVPVGTLREELRVAEAVPSDRTPIAQKHKIKSIITQDWPHLKDALPFGYTLHWIDQPSITPLLNHVFQK